MPELPEVQTTVSGLKKVLPGLTITDVWSDLPLKKHKHRTTENLKNAGYFSNFQKNITGRKILSVERRAKNILMHLDSSTHSRQAQTILIHMKMTGHLLYGKYQRVGDHWEAKDAGPLRDDPFNRFIHVVFSLSNKKQLAFSDLRKFGKIVLLDTDTLAASPHLAGIGPEPLEKGFTASKFKTAIMRRPAMKIKLALLDQSLVAGIGNIYSDEMLWHAGIHPLTRVADISPVKWQLFYRAMRKVLARGIDFGGDSTSDYRTIDGTPGKFNLHHEAYRRTGKPCNKKDGGVIVRIKLGGRSAHYCSKHQLLTSDS